jgi:2-polyprenyl-6-methoxyphenol hydroxylase-like FAD-dependent oxidoreductase
VLACERPHVPVVHPADVGQRPPHPAVHLPAPALERTVRAGVARYPNVEVLLGHECTGLDQDAVGVDLTIRRTGPDSEVRRARAAYVIAADGGSSPTRGRLNVGFEGRTFKDRWVVIDAKGQQALARGRPTRWSLRRGCWSCWPVRASGPSTSRCCVSSTTTTSASPTAGGSGGCSWLATPRMRPSGSLGSVGATISRLRILPVGPWGARRRTRPGAGICRP